MKKNYSKEELNKYKFLTDVENLQNKLKEYNNKNEINKILSKKVNDEKDSDTFLWKKEEKKFVCKAISLDAIKDYLHQIQSLNEEGINEKIKEKVKNYNEESKNEYLDKDIAKLFNKNKDNIKNNNFIGNVFAFFNLFNNYTLGYEIRSIQLIFLLFLSKKPKSQSKRNISTNKYG